jgi:LysM repeat protein
MLEIVTPTPGPAALPGTTPTATSDQTAIPQAPQGGEARPETYVVQPGDTLYGIAAKFKVDLQALVDANKITDPDSLQVGQVLVIPTPQAP